MTVVNKLNKVSEESHQSATRAGGVERGGRRRTRRKPAQAPKPVVFDVVENKENIRQVHMNEPCCKSREIFQNEFDFLGTRQQDDVQEQKKKEKKSQTMEEEESNYDVKVGNGQSNNPSRTAGRKKCVKVKDACQKKKNNLNDAFLSQKSPVSSPSSSSLPSSSMLFGTSSLVKDCKTASSIMKELNVFNADSEILVDVVARASECFPSPPSSGVFLLEERSFEIIEMARKCIRWVNESSRRTTLDLDARVATKEMQDLNGNLFCKISQELAVLRISIHCLRAISHSMLLSMTDNKRGHKKVVSIIKLLFHVISIAKDIHACIFKQQMEQMRNHGHNHVVVREIFVDTCMLCFHGYHLLGMFLSRVFLGSSGETKMVMFHTAFPIPFDGEETSTSLFMNESILSDKELSTRQLCKIATQSSLSLASVMNHICRMLFLPSVLVENDKIDKKGSLEDFKIFKDVAIWSIFGSDGLYEKHDNKEKEREDRKEEEDSLHCDWRLSFIDCFRNFISRIMAPWMVQTILQDISHTTMKEANVQDALLTPSKVSQMLLNVASLLEKSCNIEEACDMIEELHQRQSLMLQQDSIMLLLLHWKSCSHGVWISVDRDDQSNPFIQRILVGAFGKCCAAAVRAVSTYAASRGDPNYLVLSHFHRRVGGVFDQISHENDLLESQYLEYCAHRSLHNSQRHSESSRIEWTKTYCCESKTCSVSFCSLLPFSHRSYRCLNGDPELSVMALFHLCLVAKQSFRIFERREIDTVIKAFQLKVAKSNDSKLLMLSHKILSKLQLQSFSSDELLNSPKTKENYQLIYIVLQVLSKCYGPLNISIMERVNMADKDKYLYLAVALECYLKSAVLMDGIEVQNDFPFVAYDLSRDQCCVEVDCLLETCRKISMDCNINSCHKVISSVAKSISNIGKRRISVGDPAKSIFPLLASVELFSRLGDKELASRFMFISSTLQSLNLSRESLVATCYSLSIQMKNERANSFNWGSMLENIVLFCYDYVQGTIPFDSFVPNDALPELLSKALARAGRLFMNMIGNENEYQNHALGIPSSSSFIAQFMDASSLGLMDLLRYFMSSIWGKKYSSYSSNYVKLQMIAGIEFIQSFGNCAIHRIKQDTQSNEAQDVFDFLSCFLDGVKKSVEVIQGVESSLKISLTISVAAIVRRLYMTSTDTAELSHVYNSLKTIEGEVDLCLQQKWSDSTIAQLLIYKASIALLLASEKPQLSVGTSKGRKSSSRKIIELYSRAFSLLSTNSPSVEGRDLLRQYHNAVVVTMLNVFQIWNRDGYSAEAVEFVALLKILKRSDIGQIIESLITPFLAYGELHHLSYDIGTFESESRYEYIRKNIEVIGQRLKEESNIATHDDTCECEKQSDLFLKVFESSSTILSFMITSNVSKLHKVVSSMSNELPILQEIQFAYTETNSSKLRAIASVTWWLSSCFFALFLGNFRVGNFTEAHRYLRLCCDTTKHTHETFKSRRHRPPSISQSASFLASYLCSNSIAGLVRNRLGQTLQKMALLYLYAGDARKSRTYAVASAKYYSLVSLQSSPPDINLVGKYLWQIHENCRNIRSLEIRTTVATVFSLTSSFSQFDESAISLLEKMRKLEYLSYQSPFLNDRSLVTNEANVDWNGEQLKFLLLFCSRSKYLTTMSADVLYHAWQHYTMILTAMLRNSINLDVPVSLKDENSEEFIINSLQLTTHSFSNTISKAALTFVKESINRGNDLLNPRVIETLRLISQNSFAGNTDRAEALYLLAINLLQAGSESGELQALWYGFSSQRANMFHDNVKMEISDCPQLGKARDYFLQAWDLVGPSSTHLSRSILRSLALTLGPEVKCTGDTLLAGELVHSSIGSCSRQTVARKIQHDSCTDIQDIFNAFDLPYSNSSRLTALRKMHDICHRVIPPTWQFMACAICPTGELLFSVFRDFESGPRQNFSYQTFCFFPKDMDNGSECTESFLERFDYIMDQSKRQLKGGNAGEDKDMKRKWWEERYRLDEELSQLLDDFEDVFFRPMLRHELLRFGDKQDEEGTLRCGDLSARFEAACAIDSDTTRHENSEQRNLECLKDLTVVKLKEELRNLGVPQHEFRSLRKSQLIDLLHKTLQDKNTAKNLLPQENSTESHFPSDPSDDCTFLILDEHLHRLPLEGLNSLREKVVCRLPSLPFAIASMYTRTTGKNDTLPYSIDPSITKYVIDPESNLTNTRERISSVLKSAIERNGWKLEGSIGKPPSKAFMHDILHKKEGLYLYFGHGAGESFFSRADIEDVARKHSNAWQCSAVVLMGCSSGELKTVNGSYRAMSGNPIHFEPEGVALSYLCAGAPCVVANLWDVTDYDIDRFSISFLQELFQGNRTTLAQSVASSRDACKLKYLVGAAPIVFGIPVTIRETT